MQFGRFLIQSGKHKEAGLVLLAVSRCLYVVYISIFVRFDTGWYFLLLVVAFIQKIETTYLCMLILGGASCCWSLLSLTRWNQHMSMLTGRCFLPLVLAFTYYTESMYLCVLILGGEHRRADMLLIVLHSAGIFRPAVDRCDWCLRMHAVLDRGLTSTRVLMHACACCVSSSFPLHVHKASLLHAGVIILLNVVAFSFLSCL